MLVEFMRMTAGLKDLANDLFYNGQLKDGPGTAINIAGRSATARWEAFNQQRYSNLKEPPNTGSSVMHLYTILRHH